MFAVGQNVLVRMECGSDGPGLMRGSILAIEERRGLFVKFNEWPKPVWVGTWGVSLID